VKNCFTYYPYSWRYYIKKPWEFFEDTWLNLKAAWQRAKRGWADRDTWNLDSYLLEILPEMIDYLREHTHGYPGEYNGFPTPESWDNYLREEIIIPLQNAREEQTVQKNRYEEEFFSYPMEFVKEENNFTSIHFTEPRELRKKWYEREKEIGEWRQQELERGFQNLISVFWHLWD
jgi:hypothetical protein